MAIETRYTTAPQLDEYGRPLHAETAREARQGPLGRPILFVLLGGLALAAIYLIGTQIWSNSEELPPPNQIEDTATPATTTPAVNMTPATPVPAPAATPAPTFEPAAPAMTPAPAPTPVVPAG
jgi:hypothetical protein